MVSKEKRRYEENGYNLDLCYITNRIIAMGYPATGCESLYRNKRSEAQRFLQEFHSQHFLVVNLCDEKKYQYPESEFGNVQYYPFSDHETPSMELLIHACTNIYKYFDSDSKNVVVVHCKAGKGRSGCIICCFLLYINWANSKSLNTEEIMSYYGHKRTFDGKGVTIPSQRTLINAFARLLSGSNRFPHVNVTPSTKIVKAVLTDPNYSYKICSWRGKITRKQINKNSVGFEFAQSLLQSFEEQDQFMIYENNYIQVYQKKKIVGMGYFYAGFPDPQFSVTEWDKSKLKYLSVILAAM